MSDTDDLKARLKRLAGVTADIRAAHAMYSAVTTITELQQALVECDATIAALNEDVRIYRKNLDHVHQAALRRGARMIGVAAPGDALQAHDAEVRAKVLGWAAEQCRDGYGPISAYDAIMKRIREQEGEQ